LHNLKSLKQFACQRSSIREHGYLRLEMKNVLAEGGPAHDIREIEFSDRRGAPAMCDAFRSSACNVLKRQ